MKGYHTRWSATGTTAGIKAVGDGARYYSLCQTTLEGNLNIQYTYTTPASCTVSISPASSLKGDPPKKKKKAVGCYKLGVRSTLII